MKECGKQERGTPSSLSTLNLESPGSAESKGRSGRGITPPSSMLSRWICYWREHCTYTITHCRSKGSKKSNHIRMHSIC